MEGSVEAKAQKGGKKYEGELKSIWIQERQRISGTRIQQAHGVGGVMAVS